MTTPPSEPPDPSQNPPPQGPTVGPLALEAALLLDVVADRLSSIKGTTRESGSPAGESEPQPQTPAGTTASGTAADGRCPECGSVPGASCTACPLCRFMALLRGERPEATARLVDGALMIIRTLRSLVPDPPDPATPQTARPSPAHSGQQHSGQGPANQHPGRHGGLEHIDIL